MASNHTKEIRIINIIIFIVVFFSTIMPSILARPKTNAVYISPAIFSDGTSTLEHRIRKRDEQAIGTYTALISAEALSSLPKTDLGIVINRMDGQGYKLWWNGRFIGQAGDPYKGRANIWNASNVFLIEGDLVETQNTLVIQTYALYDVGMYENSLQIASWREAMRIERRFDVLSNDLTLISVGMSIFAAITILVHTVFHNYNKRKMLAIAAAMLCMSIYGIDYLQIDYFSIPYLLYKKIVTSALHFSVLFAGAAAGSSVKSKTPVTISGILLAVYLLGCILIDEIVVFKWFYNIVTLMQPLNLIIWLIILWPKIGEKSEARIFFGMFGIAASVGIWNVIALLFLPDALTSSPFPLVIIAGALLTMFLGLSGSERNRQLQAEIDQKDALFLKAVTDAQTNTYNKLYFSRLLEDVQPPFTVAMVDIDDFKALNDRWGHMLGDAGIMMVVEAIRENIGRIDIMGRYGGDEFMAALRCAPDKAKAICENIREAVENRRVKLGKQAVKMTVSIGIYHVKKKKPIEKVMGKADMALYAAKAAGKNRVVVYAKGSKTQYRL